MVLSTVSGEPPESSGWTARFFRNNVISLGSKSNAPYKIDVELFSGMKYDFWITWIKGTTSVNTEHQIVECK